MRPGDTVLVLGKLYIMCLYMSPSYHLKKYSKLKIGEGILANSELLKMYFLYWNTSVFRQQNQPFISTKPLCLILFHQNDVYLE